MIRARLTAVFLHFGGRPIDVPLDTYYGYPELDDVTNRVDSQALKVEHQINNFWTVRNTFRRIGYDTDYYTTYSNGICLLQTSGSCSTSIPSSVSANDDRLRVVRENYSGAFDQTNYFNQTEVVGIVETLGIQHTLLAGVEIGYQKKIYRSFEKYCRPAGNFYKSRSECSTAGRFAAES